MRFMPSKLPAGAIPLLFLLMSVVTPSCEDAVEDPGCDLFMGSATVSGFAVDFEGHPMPDAEVECSITDTSDCDGVFRNVIATTRTDGNGYYEALLQSGNIVGIRCVMGRVTGSDSISTGPVKFTSDCKRSEPVYNVELNLVATPSALIPDDLKITLYRMHAFSGPHYNVSVDADGYVEYYGIYDVLVEGFADTTVSLDAVLGLYRAFEDVGYWAIKEMYGRDECDYYGTDVHYACTSLTANGAAHQVLHDHGCYGIAALDSLTGLECEIDSVLNTNQWTGLTAFPCR